MSSSTGFTHYCRKLKTDVTADGEIAAVEEGKLYDPNLQSAKHVDTEDEEHDDQIKVRKNTKKNNFKKKSSRYPRERCRRYSTFNIWSLTRSDTDDANLNENNLISYEEA